MYNTLNCVLTTTYTKFIQNEMQIGKTSGKTVRSLERGGKEKAL